MRLPVLDRPAHCAAILLLSIFIAACAKPSSGEANAASTGYAETSAAVPVSRAVDRAVDPDSLCRLLSDREVHEIFPGASSGERETTREQYGITACVWQTPAGRLLVQTWAAKDASAEGEIRGLAAGFIDPLNRVAADSVRYESVTGVGEQAFAVVESQDAQRGILNDTSLLVAQHDGRILVLISDELARSDRADALAALQSLGRIAVGRL